MKKINAKSVIVLLVIVAVFMLALTGVNSYTAPLIEASGSAAELAPLYGVMPEAGGFELVYSAADPAAATLADVPETVQAIYSETSGLGYVIKLSTTKGYTGDPIELTMAVDAEGKISGIELNSFADSRHFGDEYPSTYLGQDSALGEVQLVAGVTYSSKAFKEAVEDGFAVLTANDLVSEGVKSDAQLLLEQLPAVFPGMAANGVAQYTERELSGGALTTALDSANGVGTAYFAASGDESYLIVVNDGLVATAYNAAGEDVTGTIDAAILEEATADTAANKKDYSSSESSRFVKLSADDAEVTVLPLGATYGCVSGVYEINAGGEHYYGIAARPLGYGNQPMELYFLFDDNGAIVSMSAKELILMGDYFTNYTLNESEYKAGFAGLTADTWNGEQALIAGATVSTNGVTVATDDAFAAFAAIEMNGGEG